MNEPHLTPVPSADAAGDPRVGEGTSSGARDAVLSTLTTGVILLGNLVVTALLARRGVEVFQGFNMAKRVSAAAVPVLALGLNLGIVYALAGAQTDARKRLSAAALRVSLAFCVAVTATLVAAPSGVRQQITGMGDPGFWATWLFSLGMTMNLLVYAQYRGLLQQRKANVNNLFALALLPAAVVLVAPDRWGAQHIVMAIGFVLVAWQGGRVLWTAISIGEDSPQHDDYVMLVRYSLPRVPAGLMAAGSYAIGPWVLQRGGDVNSSAFLLAALSLTQLAGAAFSGLSTVLLPRVRAMVVRRDIDATRTMVGAVMGLLLTGSIAGSTMLFFIAGDLVSVWLGPSFDSAVSLVRLVALAIPGVVMYAVMTSVTDAVAKAPIATVAASMALIVTASPLLAGSPTASMLAVSFAAGQIVAGLTVSGAAVSALGRETLLAARGSRVVLGFFISLAAGMTLARASEHVSSLASIAIALMIWVLVVSAVLVGTPAGSRVRNELMSWLR